MIEIPEGAEVEAKFELPPDKQAMCDELSAQINQRIADISNSLFWEEMSDEQLYRAMIRAEHTIEHDPEIARWRKDIALIHSVYGRNTLIVKPKL